MIKEQGMSKYSRDQVREMAQRQGFLGAYSDDPMETRYERAFLARGIPADQAKSRARAWAELKRSMPAGSVIDPDLTVDDLLMQYRLQQSDPAAAAAANNSITTAAAATPRVSGIHVSAPPVAMERPPTQFIQSSAGLDIDRYSLNPGRDHFAQILGGDVAANAPTMFGSGDLPSFTASGLDPQVLRLVPWYYRHTAALTESRGLVLMIAEQSQTGALDPEGYQTQQGRELWQDYWARISAWVATAPALDEQSSASIDQQISRLYGPDDGA
jgi:hypothetical protein